MAVRQPLRVLCLAGFRQSERGFREKTGALRKALRGRAELVCLSGPHPIVDAAGPEGAGPESGERSSAPEMRSEVVSVLPVPHNILHHIPTLYPPSWLPPSLFILPVSFIFSILTSQASTLICLPPLPMPVYSPPHFPQTAPVSRLSPCHSQPSFSHLFPLGFPLALTPSSLPYRCRALPSRGAASRLVVFRSGGRCFLRAKRAHSMQRSGGSPGNGGTGTEPAGTFRWASWFQPGGRASSSCVCP